MCVCVQLSPVANIKYSASVVSPPSSTATTTCSIPPANHHMMYSKSNLSLFLTLPIPHPYLPSLLPPHATIIVFDHVVLFLFVLFLFVLFLFVLFLFVLFLFVLFLFVLFVFYIRSFSNYNQHFFSILHASITACRSSLLPSFRILFR